MKQLKVALVQQACDEKRQRNLERSCRAIREASEAGARLVVLQELHGSRYFCQTEDPDNFDLAEPVPGPTTDQFADLAVKNGIVIVASLFEKRAAGLYHNTAVVIDDDGSIAGRYRKMHIPDDPGYYEKFYFTPGDLGFQPISTAVGKLGVLVCWDQWYPEAARLMATAGAEILIYPTAIGYDPRDEAAEQQRQRDAWQIVQRGHAIANNLPLISVNRTGFEPSADPAAPGIRFWGHSFVAGCQGEVLAEAGEEETTLLTDLDLTRREQVRRIWPFMRDRRIDVYADLTKRWRDE